MVGVPKLVVGIVLALIGLATFQYIFQVGLFRPDKPMEQVIREGLDRAGFIAASQKQKELEQFLADAEKSGQLDETKLRKLIEAAGQQANAFKDLFENWRQRHPHVPVTPPSTIPNTSKETRPSAVPNNDTETAATAPAAKSDAATTSVPAATKLPTNDGFFDTTIAVRVDREWQRLPSREKPYGLRIDGTLELDFQTQDQRSIAGPRGIAHSLLNDPEPPPGTSDVRDLSRLTIGDRTNVRVFNPAILAAPDLPYVALIGRRCDIDACSEPFVVQPNPYPVCPSTNSWLEARINDPIRAAAWPSRHKAFGEFILRPVTIPPNACSNSQTTSSNESQVTPPSRQQPPPGGGEIGGYMKRRREAQESGR